jgi:uncharacterized membrane protein
MSALPPPERPHRNVALIISICVNLVLAGIIAMAVFRLMFHAPGGVLMGGPAGGPGQPERVQVRMVMSPRLLMHAAPDKRDAIRAVMDMHRDRLDPLKAEAVNARREVLRLYGEPNLDRAALDKAFARMQQADAALEIALVKMSAEAGALLNPEERKRVLEWQPHGGRHGRGHGDGPRAEP